MAERLTTSEEVVATDSACTHIPDKDKKQTASVDPTEDRDSLQSPHTAPPSYNDLLGVSTTNVAKVPTHPIGTVLGQETSSDTAAKAHDIKVSKTTVGIVGVFVGAALCNVM